MASVPEFGAYRVLTEVVATLRGLQHHERTPADPRLLMAVLRAREDHRLFGVHGQCPRCGVDQRFVAGGRLNSDIRLDCPNCHNSLGCTLDSP